MRWLSLAVALAGCAEGVLPGPEMGVGQGTEAGVFVPPVGGPGALDATTSMSGRPDVGGAVPPRDMTSPPPDMDPPPPDQGLAAPATCASGAWTQTVAGQERSVRFEVPANPSQGAPRVLVFHGNGDTADNFCASTNLCRFLTDRGAVVATPNARHRPITVGDQTVELAWNAYDTTAANEDVALVSSVLAEIDRRCGAGPLYLWGHSQGGYFAFLVAMENDADGAVIGAAADPMPGWPWQPARTFPVAFLIGTLDFGIDNARATAQRLEGNGHPVRLMEIEGARHGGYLSGHDAELADFVGLP